MSFYLLVLSIPVALQQHTNKATHYSWRIENPLDRFTPDGLLLDISQFAEQYDLTDELKLLQRAGQLARDRKAYETIEGLSKEESDALHEEKHRPFKQPLALYITVVVCSIGAAVQ